MGQSLSQLYIHLTFGTKNRQAIIPEDIEPKLNSYYKEEIEEFVREYDIIDYDEKYFWT